MTEVYYRLHANPDAPLFAPENAYSGLWGSVFTPDGSQHECLACAGTGTGDEQRCPTCARTGGDHNCPRCDGYGVLFDQKCRECDGTGWYDAQQGYSCCHTAQELVEYMTGHGAPCDDDPVVVFEGEQVGTGFDGEPLVIPTNVIRWTTYAQIKKEAVA